MRIGIIIGRIGGVDGVALETEKWIKVLHSMGHEVFIVSGRFVKNVVGPERQSMLPVLAFAAPQCRWEQNKAYLNPDPHPWNLMRDVTRTAAKIKSALRKWIDKYKIEALISENANALPYHLSMGVAIKEVVEETGIRTICHDHDFAWERGDRYNSPHQEINELVRAAFPLVNNNVVHATINQAAQTKLKDDFKTDSVLVPNVMDFNKSYGEKTEYNATLPKDLGLKSGDIPLFQVTRIIPRKRIETAIELVRRIEDPRVKLVITGDCRDDTTQYYNLLLEMIHDMELSERVLFGARWIKEEERHGPSGRQIYTLSDAYAHATACTYFSTYEGFGNAFVEAVVAKKPVFVNNYKPVYWPDIGSKGFRAVMIEDSQLTDQAVDEIYKVLADPVLQREIGEHNYQLGRKLYSFEVLEQKLGQLLS